MEPENDGEQLLPSREAAPVAGLYLAEDHYHEGFRLEVVLGAGNRLPDCPHCGEATTWKYMGRYGRRVIEKEGLARRLALQEDTLLAEETSPSCTSEGQTWAVVSH